jgi:tRNA dimethylallyltransferase
MEQMASSASASNRAISDVSLTMIHTVSAEAILIAGPTASGKSRAALELAQTVGGVIINADSMQVYREPRLLTARPSDADMSRAPHLLYGHVAADDAYSTGRYQSDAGHALHEVRAAGRIPIFVGGTGLYFTALTQGLSEMPTIPAGVREMVRDRRERIGAEAFHAELAARDPIMAEELPAADTQRMLRAMEVLDATGRSLAFWQANAGKPVLDGLSLARFVIDVPRTLLRARIDARFRAMLAQGAMEEALTLENLDPALPAAKIIGRRELLALHDGAMTQEEAIEKAVIATGQYAKRQDTWFRNQLPDWTRLDGASHKIVAEMITVL